MLRPIFITPDFAVAGALEPRVVHEVAKLGFRSLLNNRPDGEEPGQLTARTEADLAAEAGLAYRHVPARMYEVFSASIVTAERETLADLPRPILAHCKSGQRSAVLWAAARVADGEDVDGVLSNLRQAGFSFDALRDDLVSVARTLGRAGKTSPNS